MIISKSSAKTQEQKEDQEKDKEWACAVKNRDGWCCVICGSKYAPNAHHIITRENKNYRWDVHNGISLCVAHHKFSRIISAHNQPVAFFMWLQKYRQFQYKLAEERVREMLLGDIVI